MSEEKTIQELAEEKNKKELLDYKVSKTAKLLKDIKKLEKEIEYKNKEIKDVEKIEFIPDNNCPNGWTQMCSGSDYPTIRV